MKAIEAINEILDAIVEDAELHPEENGNTQALIDRVKRDIAMLPERCNIEIDDDEEDDDIGVDVSADEKVTTSKKSEPGSGGGVGSKKQSAASE